MLGFAAFHSVEFLGFYLPPLLLWSVVAIVPYLIATWLMRRLALYRFIWHRSLFNLALYVNITGGLLFIGTRAWL